MSTATVRAAVAAWFAGTPGFGRVWKGQPKVQVPADFDSGSGTLVPTAYVHMDNRVETRIAGPAGAGIKQVTHTVGLVVTVRWWLTPDGGQDEWTAAVDAATDAVVDRLRADHNLGTAGEVVWLAGEGQADVQMAQDLPVYGDTVGELKTVVQFQVVEMVQGV
jgi:hypothetical protein